VEDEPGVADLLELNGLPRTLAFEERFIVAGEEGRLLAALQYRMYSKRLVLGLLVTDPWVEESPLAVALYAKAGGLARELGVVEILARPVRRTDHLYKAGYRRTGRGWRLDTARPSWDIEELPESGWRRVATLLGILTIPFHRAFRD
jgi:hypothetical protein